MLDEIWKDIENYEGLYQVSTLGRIKSLAGRPHIVKDRILNIWVGTHYYATCLSKNKKPKFYLVHRLMAVAFVENPYNKPHVNHKDGNKLNNSLDNLEWVTHKENIQHAVDTGLKVALKGKDHYKYGVFGKDNFLSKSVIQMDVNGNVLSKFDSMTEMAKYLNVNKGLISRACSGELKTFRGFIFKCA